VVVAEGAVVDVDLMGARSDEVQQTRLIVCKSTAVHRQGTLACTRDIEDGRAAVGRVGGGIGIQPRHRQIFNGGRGRSTGGGGEIDHAVGTAADMLHHCAGLCSDGAALGDGEDGAAGLAPGHIGAVAVNHNVLRYNGTAAYVEEVAGIGLVAHQRPIGNPLQAEGDRLPFPNRNGVHHIDDVLALRFGVGSQDRLGPVKGRHGSLRRQAVVFVVTGVHLLCRGAEINRRADFLVADHVVNAVVRIHDRLKIGVQIVSQTVRRHIYLGDLVGVIASEQDRIDVNVTKGHLQRAALHIADGLCRIDAICAIVIIHIDLADFHSILGAVQHNLAAPHGIDLGAARLLCAGVVLNGAAGEVQRTIAGIARAGIANGDATGDCAGGIAGYCTAVHVEDDALQGADGGAHRGMVIREDAAVDGEGCRCAGAH
jgi:hypothetical protein